MDRTKPLFAIGEVAILQPPHPSAKAYWGMETTILRVIESNNNEDAFGGFRTGWSYDTDIPAPPPSDDPRHQNRRWVWCEYDLRKKYDAGEDFKTLVKNLKKPLEVTELIYE